MTLAKLRKIAGVDDSPKVDKSDSYGQTQINKSEDWIKRNSTLPSNKKLEAWMTEFKDWTFTPNNREYYWNTMRSMSGLSDSEFQKFTTEDIKGKIDKLHEMSDKERYFRDNAYTWPDYTLKSLSNYFENIKGTNYAKELERNRISQVIEVKDLLRNTTFNLDPDISLETHTDDFIKAYDLGYTEEISTDDRGRISIIKDGERLPVYSLPDPDLTLQEQLISLNDLRAIAKDSIKPSLEGQRAAVKKQERTVKKSLLRRAENGEIPQEFFANIVIDGTEDEPDPVKSIRYTVLQSVTKKFEAGMYRNLKDILTDYTRHIQTIHRTLYRRLKDGEYS